MSFAAKYIVTIKIKTILTIFLSSICVFGNISFVLPGLFNQVASAEGLKPICSGGEVNRNDGLTTFNIVLNCSNVAGFVKYGTTLADSSDLVKIKLHPGFGDENPDNAIIIGNQMKLIFPASYSSKDRSIEIDSGAILSSSGSTNDKILITSDAITDRSLPNIVDDYYSANQGSASNITADLGVLFNDSDNETSVQNSVLISGPSYGSVILKLDGSFVYTPSDNYSGNDSFVYSAMDIAGNQGSATVHMYDTAPQLKKANFYKQGVGDSKYAKIGDTVRVDYETDEPVVNISGIIAGHNANVQIIDGTHFYVYYIMQGDDSEGMIGCSMIAYDSVGTPVNYSNNEDGIIFDKSSPVIDLRGEPEISLEKHEPYIETVKVTDTRDGILVPTIVGRVNSNMVGIYKLVYSATDRAGNESEVVTRTVNIIDSIAMEFNDISDELNISGLDNNLASVNIDNYYNFIGLYIEKSVNGVKIGRITFNNSLDMSDGLIRDFIYELGDRMSVYSIGTIGFNVTNAIDLLNYFGKNATLKFYNLDKLGFNNSSSLNDIFSKLDIYDDDGRKMNDSSFDRKSAIYVGCSNIQVECYTFTLNINHFSKYVINKIKYPEIDIAKTIQIQSSSDINNITTDYNEPSNYSIQIGQEPLIAQNVRQAIDTKSVKKDEAKIDSRIVAGLKWQWWIMALMAAGLLYWIGLAFIHWCKKLN